MQMRPLVILAILASTGITAADAPAPSEPKWEMTTYQFCFLNTVADAPQLPAEVAERTQQAHLDYLKSLLTDGRAVIVGPLKDAGGHRGVVVLDVPATDADAILAADPWVKAGQLAVERHPWFAAKGILRKPTNPIDLRSAWLGLLVRPAGAPWVEKERAQQIQRGHMANIERMAESGDLVIAGPMAEDGPLRGLLVFRTESADRVRELVAQDPAIQARRLELQLLHWLVPKESFPEK